MKKNLLSVILLLTGSLLFSQQKTALTHESMWMMKRVGAPAVSPDGKWVVFGLLEPSYDEKTQVNDIWIVAADGSKPARKLTAAKAGENAYTWSPDGGQLAFVAKRDGEEESQIYLLNVREGGEAQRLTRLSSGAGAPQWSPDGSHLMFTSNVYPLCYEDSLHQKKVQEKKDRKYTARVYTQFPIRAWDRWLDEKQAHIYVQAAHPDSAARNLFAGVALSREAGFSLSSAAWSPDGKHIVFSATADAHTAAWQQPSYHLYQLAVSGGDAKKITPDGFQYREPVFTPDGKYLLCTTTPAKAYVVYNQGNITRFDWPSMTNRRDLTAELDRPVNNYVPYGNTLYLSVEDEGRDRLYTLSMEGGKPKPWSKAPAGGFTNLHGATGTNPVWVASYESATRPAELVRISVDGSHQDLTAFNSEALKGLDLPEPETFWFTTSRGKRIRSMVVKPAGFDPAIKYPLFVVMHGGPAGSWKESWGYRWNYHLLAQPGYVLLLTDYTGSTGYGEKFGQDIQYDPFKGPADEINEAAAEAIKRYAFIDGSRQAAGGGSYGGHLAYWMAATTSHYKCLIAHAGAVNLVSQWGISDVIYGREVMNGGAPWTQTETWKTQNPYLYADKFNTPMLITVGEKDYRVPFSNSIEAWHILQRRQVPGKLIVFPDENHWILNAENSRFFYQEVHDWLKAYLQP